MSDEKAFRAPHERVKLIWDPIKGDWIKKKRRPNRHKKDQRDKKAQILLKRDGAYCYLCGEIQIPWRMVVEHKIPLSRGGTNDISNLAMACKDCDTAKGSMTEEEYRATLR